MIHALAEAGKSIRSAAAKHKTLIEEKMLSA